MGSTTHGASVLSLSILSSPHPPSWMPPQPRPVSPVAVELHVSGHLAVGHCVRQLLQLQGLEVHALALVRHDEVGVQGTPGASGLIPVWEQENRSPGLP